MTIWAYIAKRLMLIPPTLFVILLVNFSLVQFAPGGPVEYFIGQLKHHGTGAEAAGVSSVGAANISVGLYPGARGLDEELRQQLRVQFGFDKSPTERFLLMVSQYLRFDFGNSYFLGRSVWQVILEKLPVSIALGIVSTVPVYLIGIPLGIAKAVRHGQRFDIFTSFLLTIFYAMPAFLLAMLLLVVFAGGSMVQWFPLRGIMSDAATSWAWYWRVLDMAHHLVLPALAMGLAHLAAVTIWMKNSFLEEISKQYTITARAKGASEQRVLYKHVFANACIVLIAGLPGMLLAMLFTGNILIERLFSLDGLGLLSFESLGRRDYPVVFGMLYVFTLLGMLINVLGDLLYVWVDPRIAFDKK